MHKALIAPSLMLIIFCGIYFSLHGLAIHDLKIILSLNAVILGLWIVKMASVGWTRSWIGYKEIVFIFLVANIILAIRNDGLANNFVVENEMERFRGIFPILTVIFLIIKERGKSALSVILKLSVATIFFFLVTGTRGGILYMAIIASCFALPSTLRLWALFLSGFIYHVTVPLLLPLLLPALEGNVALKISGYLYAVQGFSFWGQGVLPPLSAGYSPVDFHGFYFRPADYGIVGLMYEAGIIFVMVKIAMLLYFLRYFLSRCSHTPHREAVVTVISFSAGMYGLGVDVLQVMSVYLFCWPGQRNGSPQSFR